MSVPTEEWIHLTWVRLATEKSKEVDRLRAALRHIADGPIHAQDTAEYARRALAAAPKEEAP